jgi:hypothetical protein
VLIAILPDTSHAETLLNNLSEAGFDLAQVSVVMRDLRLRDAIAQDAGPLKGVMLGNLVGKLARAGLPKTEARPFADAVAQGKVMVAILTPPQSQPAAKEMLQDHSAEMIRELT